MIFKEALGATGSDLHLVLKVKKWERVASAFLLLHIETDSAYLLGHASLFETIHCIPLQKPAD